MEKISVPQDWHKADIKAALEKKGLNMAYLSRLHGLNKITISKALQYPYIKAERIIAEAIGVSAETIWPSRYQVRATRKAQFQCNPERIKPARFNAGVCLDAELK